MRQLPRLLVVFSAVLSLAFSAPCAAAGADINGPQAPAVEDDGKQQGDEKQSDDAATENAKPSDASKQEESPTQESPKQESPKQSDQAPSCPDAAKKTAAATAKKAASAQKGDAPSDKPCPDAPHHTVERAPLKVKVSLDGALAATRRAELRLEPEHWSDFEVKRVLDHGAIVQKGQVLVEFDTESFDRAIADLEREVELGELALDVARRELEYHERFTPKDIEIVERAYKQTRDDHRFALEVLYPLQREMADMNLQQAEFALEYQREELEQLEKMYKADELTEETERIVLERARNSVKQAEFYYKQAKILHERITETRLPREITDAKEQNERQLAMLKRQKALLPLQKEELTLKVEQLETEQQRKRERLDELQGDRRWMVLKAPSDGMLYYGHGEDGNWDSNKWIEKLREGEKVPAGGVLMTVVEPDAMVVLTEVPEKELHQVREKVRGTVTPVAFPKRKLSARVAKMDRTPNGSGKYEAELRFQFDGDGERLLPGMKCKIELVPYRERKALVVPAKAVFTDEWDEQQRFVYLHCEGKPPKRQNVTIGHQTEELIEIEQGVREGDVVLLKCPKKKS